jgi:ribonuclease P/MRP protein subunit POP5
MPEVWSTTRYYERCLFTFRPADSSPIKSSRTAFTSRRQGSDGRFIERAAKYHQTQYTKRKGARMKPLRPTLRDSFRYVAFTLSSEEPVRTRDLQTEIFKAAKSLFGDVGVSKSGIKVVMSDGTKGLVRCHYRHVPDVQATLATIGKIENNRVRATVIGTSGTIKAAIEKYLQIDERIRRTISSYVTVPVSGKAVRMRGKEIDIIPEDREIVDRADVQFIGITIDDNERLI